MSKRAVSPLIAAILLIALTVSIGAMIIGWGRQYVQQQTSCLGASATITSVSVVASKQTMDVTIENTGSQPIVAKNLIFYVYDVDGNKHEITVQSGKNPTFNIGGTTSQVLRPGQTGTITVNSTNFNGITNLNNCDDYISVELAVQGCGVISNRYSIYQCSS